MLDVNEVYQGNCLDWMELIDDQSIDMILCDLPYGTTACKWDSIIPLESLWAQYKRIIKNNGAIVLTASQPFTTVLIHSNIKMFKYEIIWKKCKPSNFLNAKKQVLKQHENVLIFYSKQCTYNPQMWESKPMNTVYKSGGLNDGCTFNNSKSMKSVDVDSSKRNRTLRNPVSVLLGINEPIGNSAEKKAGKHPTQKPVALFEYLIKTYTQPGELVLDNCAGSGTTAIACINTDRNFILIEKEPDYVQICEQRIKDALQ